MRRINKVLTAFMAVPAMWIAASDQMIWAMPSARAVALRVEPVPVSPASPLPSLSQGETL